TLVEEQMSPWKDEHVESVSVDVISNIAPSDVKTVKTIDVNHKGMFSTEEPKPVMKNNFYPLIIEDCHSDDESEDVRPIRNNSNKVNHKNFANKLTHPYPKRGFVPQAVLTSGEAELKLKELMELCIKLSDRVLDLEKTKSAQAKELADLKKRVKKLERKRRSRTLRMNLFKIGTSRRKSLCEDDAFKQGRNLKQRRIVRIKRLLTAVKVTAVCKR
nr:hypothetical protein [Tanacetum cinerariifolium]